MKKFILPIIFASFFLSIQSIEGQQFTLVKKGSAKSRIIIPEKPTVMEIRAAKVLQDYIQRISGAIIPIEADSIQQQKGEILIGNVNRPELKQVPKELGKDGLFIKSNRSNLVITGGADKGILYGVYTFL